MFLLLYSPSCHLIVSISSTWLPRGKKATLLFLCFRTSQGENTQPAMPVTSTDNPSPVAFACIFMPLLKLFGQFLYSQYIKSFGHMRYRNHFLSKYVTPLGAGDSTLLMDFQYTQNSHLKRTLGEDSLPKQSSLPGEQNEQMGTGVRFTNRKELSRQCQWNGSSGKNPVSQTYGFKTTNQQPPLSNPNLQLFK